MPRCGIFPAISHAAFEPEWSLCVHDIQFLPKQTYFAYQELNESLYKDEKKKLLHVFTPNNKYSKLLKPFAKYIIHMSALEQAVAYKKTGIGVRSKP